MLKLVRLNSEREALMLTESLKSQGIESRFQGSKEYTSIVLGTDQGYYDVYVNPEKFIDAQKFMKSLLLQSVPSESLKPTAKAYLKKAVVCAFLAIFLLPIVFNFVSLKNLNLYLKSEPSAANRTLWLILVLLLQIPSVMMLYMIFQTYSEVSTLFSANEISP